MTSSKNEQGVSVGIFRRSLGINGWRTGLSEPGSGRRVSNALFHATCEVLTPASYDIGQYEQATPVENHSNQLYLGGVLADLLNSSATVVAGAVVALSTKNLEAGIASAIPARLIFNAATHAVTKRFIKKV